MAADVQQFSFLSALFRLLLAVSAGAAIGYGRSRKQRNAGLRTYTLVSIGAALTVLISIYEWDMLCTNWAWVGEITEIKFDGTRFAAQVISGVGFLAAGTIISVAHQQVSGLTSAIGLFGAAALGIAVGAGFYEGALIAVILVLISEIFLSNLSSKIKRKPMFHIQITYQQKAALDNVLRYCKDNRFSIINLQVTGIYDTDAPLYTAVISLRSRKYDTIGTMLSHIEQSEGVLSAEMADL